MNRRKYMKCLNCGRQSKNYLCDCCQNPDVLDKIFNEILFYKQENCENSYLLEFASSFNEKNDVKDIIPDILTLFDFKTSEFYYCRYYKYRRDDRFENAAIMYVNTHEFENIHTQNVLYDLINSYIPNDFIKPKKWCERIYKSDNLCCELYAIAAKYFAMIGEYEQSDEIATKGLLLCSSKDLGTFLFSTPENMIKNLENQKRTTEKYRTKKPYWPTTEERRRAVAMFYDERGIKYPRIESKPKKIEENEFIPPKECIEYDLHDYCTFWCAETFNAVNKNNIYQIAAVKVCNDVIVGEFQQFIRPWDGGSPTREEAAMKAGVELSVIESAEDVDLVMKKFFSFVENNVLISTGALRDQEKLISRATRYAGMREIKNEFCDLLDLAADISSEFDFKNNTRKYLLEHFSIEEGKSALEKAKINKQLYDDLKIYEK